MQHYDIPSTPLENAIAAFRLQSGVAVEANPKLAADKISPGLHGDYNAPEGLALLLAHTGLQALRQDDGSYVLVTADTPDASADTLPKVSITGKAATPGYVETNNLRVTKSDESLIETPQSVSVVTRQQLDDQQPQSINEALRYSPGVIPESEGTTSNFWGGNSLQLRGFTPGVYVDGLQDDNYGNGMVDPYFYQSVEVLSGPASVLFGQASPGGIVNIVSKQPTASPIREITMGIGNYDRFQAGFDVGGPINQDQHWLYRLTGVGLTQSTQTDWIKHKRYGIAPAFTWQPSTDTRLTLLANYTYSPAMGDYSDVPAVGAVLPSPLGKVSADFSPGDPNFNTATQRLGMIGYQFEHRFDEHLKFEQDARITDNRNEANMIWPSGLEADGATLDRYAFVRHMRARSYLIDNRLMTRFDLGPLKNDLLVGINASHFVENWAWGSSDVSPINIFSPVYGVPIQGPDPASFSAEDNHANQIGVYVQDQIALDRWRLLVAARQDWVKEDQTSQDPSLVIPNQADRKLTGHAGVVYLFDNGLAPYASYSTSFQPQFGSLTSAGTPAKPTTGQQYEVGVKYQPTRSNHLLTLAAYDLTEQNVPESDPANPGFVVQVGEIRSRGVELSDRAKVSRNLDLIASYAYTDSRYTRTPALDAAYDGTLLPVQGKYQYAVPKQSMSVWADYKMHGSGLAGIAFSGGARYVGSTYGDDVNSFKVPAATLVDAAIRYDMGVANEAWRGLKLQLNIANLFDKQYVSSCSGSTICNFGVRRTIYASAAYDW
jgi:iron complex outermembrane receptor protein